ncbi:unnamed protein product [Closterium sp. NIES-53]
MKNRWVLTTKYRIDDNVEREKARLVVKGFTKVCGADYDETYSPVSSYVMLRIFHSIIAVLDLNLMQLDMKNAFLQSKLDRVLYMYQPDYFDDGTSQKSQVDEALYIKAGDNGVTCWVLVYVDNLLAASNRPAILKDLKELLEAAFELRDIFRIVKYVGLEIVRDRSARKLWLHQQGYIDKLRRRFIDKEQGEFGGGPESLELIGYVDADDAGDKQNRTSTGGYVFVYGGAALLDAGKPTILRVDNESAITVAEGLGLMGNLKHMERRYAWLQHMVRRGKFMLKYIPTTEQPADFLTKVLHFPAFNRCFVAIGQVRLANVGDGDDDVQQ